MGVLKPREEFGPDAKGIRTIITYRHASDGGVEKVTQKVRTVEKITRVSPAVEERRSAPKFGLATVGSGENITYVSVDEVFIEKPGVAVNEPVLDPKSTVMFTCRHCGKVGDHWTRMCPYKDLIQAGGSVPVDATPETDEPAVGGLGSGKGSYVPPAKRGGGSTWEDDDDSKRTLKVMNLSKDAEREDLYELFGRYGSIERVNLVRHYETKESRGMAFVCFRMREDAQKALDALDGHPYGYQIISIEWAKPRSDRNTHRSLSEMKVTGYGKALPQGMSGGRK